MKQKKHVTMSRKKQWLPRTLKVVLALVLCFQMILGDWIPTMAVNAAAEEKATEMVLDSAWEVENPTDGKLRVNEDGSITITTESGAIGDGTMHNVLYYKLPNTADYNFTVKVKGNFLKNYQGAHLMITSGKELANVVGVVRRYHGYLGGNYGTNMLMGVMQVGNPLEYYEGAPDIGNEFYLRLRKQNGRITGFYAKEYSENSDDWNQIIDPTKNNIGYVDKGNALIDPENIYVAIAATNGGGNTPTEITFSELRVGGELIPFTTNPSSLNKAVLSGQTKMDVNATQQLVLTGFDYSENEITEFDSVVYKSNDEDVATVDEKGVVTGLKNGNVQITAEVTSKGVTKTAMLEIQVGEIIAEESWELTSPDGNTKMLVEMLTGGVLQYHAEKNGVENIGTSPLGMVTNLGDFSKGLVLKEASEVKEINESYNMLSGKRDVYTDHCNEQTITFTRKNDDSVEFDLVIRAYDDGTAYRYAIRTAEEGKELLISDETSGLQLPAGADVHWMNYSSSTWNYEGMYETTTTEGLKVGATPSIPFLYGKDGVWTLFSEADLNGTYTGSMLKVKENGMMDVAFSKTQGNTEVKTTTPFKSPWRAAITGTPEDIVENTMIENLSTPADYETYDYESWVDPGLSSWSWVTNWGSGISDQSKAETHLNWIEFGAEIGWDYYILDEGWNVGGRGHVSGMHDWWPQVRDFAKEKGVRLWAWVHVSDIDTPEERERHFSEWTKEGIVGIKPDFFDGEDQKHMQLYDDLYKDAAKYHLMVLAHGANKPTGEIRTYPNVYGREAIRGQENGISAEQYTLIPFIRAAIGPAEVTEELRSKDYNKTTMGFQIALTALVEDGIHSMGSAPDVYRGVPEAMSYYKNYPDKWDETQFVNGEIGKYVSIARLAGSNWYSSGISVEPGTMEIPMEFLDDGKDYTVILYKENGRRDIDMEVITGVTNQSVLNADVLAGGGYALRAIPADEVNAITSIITDVTEITVEKGHASEPVSVTVDPEDAQFKDVVWKSADENIATVDQKGVIQGVSKGETIITVASLYDENVKAEMKVTVTPERYVLNDAKWTILKQNDKVLINDINSATITTQRGVLGDRNWNNMFAMDVPEGEEDFTITAKISGGLKANFQGGFITVFDKENPDGLSVAAGRRYHTYLMGSHPNAFSVMTTGGSISEFYCNDDKHTNEVYVKLQKTGGTFISSYSYDGTEWTEITNKGNTVDVTNTRLAASENLCVGFYAGSGGSDDAVDVTVSDFTFNGVKVPIAIDTKATEDVDKEDLAALIEYAQSQKENAAYDFVVPAVKKAFEAALDTAEKVLENTATQAEVDKAYDRLLKMVQMLDFTGNKTALSKMVQQVQNLKKELYTAATWEVFEDARTKAQGVLDNENSLQAEIDDARVALRNAIFQLRLIPDKGQLEGLIKSAGAVDTTNYTVKSATAFVAALDHAKLVFADENATEEEVKAAEKSLQEAQKNLVAKVDEEKDVSKEAEKAADKTAAKTGDAGQMTVMLTMLMAAAAAILSFRRKARR